MMHHDLLLKRIKERREVLGITQAHLAELSGIGLRTVKEIEGGLGNPRVETLSKIAEVLGMELRLELKGTLR